MEAWVRVGLGRSLMRESAVEDQLVGVAQMLHVPARLRGESPYLAGVALGGAAVHASASSSGVVSGRASVSLGVS